MSQDFDEHQEHSERGPSTASRWRKCPASVRESRGLEDTPTIYAAEGTVFHHYAALCLKFGFDPALFIGAQRTVEPFGKLRFTEEMAKKMMPGLHFARSFMREGAQVYVERKVSLKNWIGKGEFGSIDLLIVNFDDAEIVDFDWKWGAGVPVQPEWNDQAILYTLGGWDAFARDEFARRGVRARDVKVIIAIEQPRAPGGGGVWETNMHDLLREGRKIREDADATLDPDAPYRPGEACKFCRAARRNTCKARARHVAKSLGQKFDQLDSEFAEGRKMKLPERKALTPEQRSQLLLHRKLIEDFLKQIHDEAVDDLKKGRAIPGLKIVAGRNPPRKWCDPNVTRLIMDNELGEEAYERKYLTPNQLEEKVGRLQYKQVWQHHVDHGEAKPILVDKTDKRPAIEDLTRRFDDIIEDA